MRRLALPPALVLAGPAEVDLTQVELDAVGASPGVSAAVPDDLGLLDGTRPLMLVLADFECPDICDPLVAQTAAALEGKGLVPGEDHRLAVVGLEPRDGEAARTRFLDGAVEPGSLRRTTLTPRLAPPELECLTEALGFRHAFDAARDRFAHPVLAYVLTPDGRVSRVFPSLQSKEPAEMRHALVEAGGGAVDGLLERHALTCYGFDPVTGRCSLLIERTPSILSLAFATALLGAVAWAVLRERRRGEA